MAYEIPKNLQYTEKIIFNLSFEQAAWIGLFGLIGFTIYFKLPLILELRVILLLLLAGITVGFAFFDFRNHTTSLLHFIRTPKETGYLDPKIGQFLAIKSIENDVVFLQNNSMNAIIQVQPINFHILSLRQKQAIISAYKDFLNGLDFPIQIVMRTVHVELDDYLKKLEIKVKIQKKQKLETQFEDFQSFVKKYIEEKGVKNRQFYIIVPFTSEKNMWRTKIDPFEQLNIRVRLCQDKLKNCNLITKRLSNNELVSLFSSYFSGFMEVEKEYRKNIVNSSKDHRSAELIQLLKPSYIKNAVDSIQINEQFNRIIMAVGYPRAIREGWLDTIISSEGNYDLSLHIHPSNVETILTQLNQELVKQEADLFAAQSKGIVNPSLRLQHQDTMNVLEKLQKGEEKLFNLSLYINARAYSKDKLELLSRKIQSELNSMLIIPKIPFLRMDDAVKSIFPIQEDKLKMTRNIPSDALSACFPFTTAFLNLDEDGILFGLNKSNNIPIILDPYKFANYNGLILGTSGGGKSVTAKLFILRNQMRGVKTMIIDPQGEYVELTRNYEGQVIEISRNSKTIINPFDLMGQDLGEKMLSLIDLFKIMCGDLTEVQKNILDKAIQNVYEQKGIIHNNPETWNRKPPIMEDLYYEIVNEKKVASRTERMTYEALENRLRIYAKGTFSFINKQTNLDLSNDLICFNIAQMPNQIKPVMMFLIMDFVHKKMQKDRERKALIIDEAWTLLRFAEHSKHIFELIKTARKFGLAIVILTQEVQDLLTSEAGKTILANTSWKFLARQEPTVIDELTHKFNLNNEEQNYLLTALPGEGLLFAMNDHIPIKVVPSPSEYDLITTNPDEVKKREDQLRKLDTKIEENLEPFQKNKKYYLKSKLNNDHISFLKENGYVEARLCGLENSSRWYLIQQPESRESIEHYFMVQVIANEIRKYTSEVILYPSSGPDIVFKMPNSRSNNSYAIEVETGSHLKKLPDLKEKTSINDKQKYHEWFFIVTDKTIKSDFEKYHPTMTRIECREWINHLFQRSDA